MSKNKTLTTIKVGFIVYIFCRRDLLQHYKSIYIETICQKIRQLSNKSRFR